MSSCFLCDCSYSMTTDNMYSVVYAEGKSEPHYMKYMPIMVGSSGLEVDPRYHTIDGTDQQHKDNNKQNYVSYRVKKMDFRASVCINALVAGLDPHIPNYIILFKVPFREPVFDYYFTIMKNFILYSEPESILKYGVYGNPLEVGDTVLSKQYNSDKYDLFFNKPFIVGPNDYVGVLYFFDRKVNIQSSVRVWFDIV